MCATLVKYVNEQMIGVIVKMTMSFEVTIVNKLHKAVIEKKSLVREEDVCLIALMAM